MVSGREGPLSRRSRLLSAAERISISVRARSIRRRLAVFGGFSFQACPRYDRVANTFVGAVALSVPFLACMAAAAAFYHLPPRVLPSIQVVEGGKVGSAHINSDGTADLGVMQINTIWVQPLASVTKMTPDRVIHRLVEDPCFNIEASAAIMRTYLNEAHGNLMAAVGYYHSHSPDLGVPYRDKVVEAAAQLFGRPRNR